MKQFKTINKYGDIQVWSLADYDNDENLMQSDYNEYKKMGMIYNEKDGKKMKKEYTLEEVKSIMEECFMYDNSFEDIYCYDMDSVEEWLNGLDVTTIMNMVHFGEYNPNCEYFRFDGYGNIESVYESEYLENIEDREAEILEHAKELGIL